MVRRKSECMKRKVAKVMRENRDKPKKQRIAMALNIARRHCGVKNKYLKGKKRK